MDRQVVAAEFPSLSSSLDTNVKVGNRETPKAVPRTLITQVKNIQPTSSLFKIHFY